MSWISPLANCFKQNMQDQWVINRSYSLRSGQPEVTPVIFKVFKYHPKKKKMMARALGDDTELTLSTFHFRIATEAEIAQAVAKRLNGQEPKHRPIYNDQGIPVDWAVRR